MFVNYSPMPGSSTLYDQIVIGTGTSALTFVYCALEADSAKFRSQKMLVVGESDLWQKAGSLKGGGEYEMGQPNQFLHSIDRPVAPGSNQNFLKVSDYNRQLDGLKKTIGNDHQNVSFCNDRVRRVVPFGGGYYVETVKQRRYQAKRVVVACGPGRGSISPVARPSVVEDYPVLMANRRPYQELIAADDYLTSFQPKGLRVVIDGGQPTAAWAAAHAVYSGASMVLWITHRSFDGCNPAGRNSAIVLYATENDMMALAGVNKITALRVAEPTPRLRVQLKAPTVAVGKAPLDGSVGDLSLKALGPQTIDVHQYVYAYGADPKLPGGAHSLLDQKILDGLNPVFDSTGRFGKNASDTVVAYSNVDGSVWVVGAAVFREMGGLANLAGSQQKYLNIPNMLCAAGTPPEGIAAVKASIKAVTDFYQPIDHDFNWKTADRAELLQFVAWWYKDMAYKSVPSQTRELVVDAIIDAQKKTTFGLDQRALALMLYQRVYAQPEWTSRDPNTLGRFLNACFLGKLSGQPLKMVTQAVISAGKKTLADVITFAFDKAKELQPNAF